MANRSNSKSPPSLREQAEAAWQGRRRGSATIAPKDAGALVHELEVHQIELELQNEELRRAQSELEESRDQLRDLYDFAPVGYLTLREDAVIQQANLRAAVLLGVERDALIGKRFTRFLARESQDAFHLYWRALYPDGPPQACDLVLHKSDGTAVFVSMETAEQKGAGSIAWCCTISDITARKQAEAKLRESEERYHLAVEAAPNGIVITQADGEIILVNSHAEKQFGYSREELLGKRLEILVPERFRGVYQEYRRTFQNQPDARPMGARREFNGLRKDQTEFPIEIALNSIGTGQEALVLGSIVDMTERKQGEATSLLLASVVQSSADGIISLDLNAVITSWNRGAEWILGYSAEEVMGRTISVLIPAGYVDHTRTMLERVKRGESIEQYETVRQAKNGAHINVSITWSPIHDANGRVLGVSKILRDITEQKRLAEQRLELVAKERALASERALRETEGKLARVARISSIGELATSISHEINQPLAGVVTNAAAGLRWLSGKTPNLQEARESLALVARDGNRASAVIRRIREFLKKGDRERTPLDITEVIEETLALARAELQKQQVTIKIELSGDVPPVCGDRIQLQQVILNLLLNGADAMAAVEGTRELLVRSHISAAARAVVAVRDSGIGISPQDMPRLFDAFFTTKPDGMGMGLSISRTIIEAHGGRIWAELNNGPGLTVQFELPVEGTSRAWA